MRPSIIALAAAFVVSAAGIATAQAPDLIVKKSAHDVAATVQRLQAAIAERGAKVVAIVDHAAAAKAAGMELRPTTAIMFGNPKLGTPMMQASQQSGLDLPLRMVVWQDADGAVQIGYWNPAKLTATHGIAGQEDTVKTMTGALAGISEQAAKP